MEIGTGIAILGASIALATMLIALFKFLKESGRLSSGNNESAVSRQEYETRLKNHELWFRTIDKKLQDLCQLLDSNYKEQQKLCSSRAERITALETKVFGSKGKNNERSSDHQG